MSVYDLIVCSILFCGRIEVLEVLANFCERVLLHDHEFSSRIFPTMTPTQTLVPVGSISDRELRSSLFKSLWVSLQRGRIHLHLRKQYVRSCSLSLCGSRGFFSVSISLDSGTQISSQSRSLFPISMSHSGALQNVSRLTHLPFNPEESLDSCLTCFCGNFALLQH